MSRKHALEVTAFELGILWGLTMREELRNDIPETLRNKIHTLIDMAYETATKGEPKQ